MSGADQKSWKKIQREEDLRFWFAVSVCVVVLSLIGFFLGYHTQPAALCVITAAGIVLSWLHGRAHGDAIAFVCTLYVSLVAWVTYYFVSDQHWVGDFMHTHILR